MLRAVYANLMVDRVQLIALHLIVGVVWMLVATALLISSLRVRRVLRTSKMDTRVFAPILIAGYAFFSTSILHLIEELSELWDMELLDITVSLFNHVILVSLFAIILYSVRRYRGMLEALTYRPQK